MNPRFEHAKKALDFMRDILGHRLSTNRWLHESVVMEAWVEQKVHRVQSQTVLEKQKITNAQSELKALGLDEVNAYRLDYEGIKPNLGYLKFIPDIGSTPNLIIIKKLCIAAMMELEKEHGVCDDITKYNIVSLAVVFCGAGSSRELNDYATLLIRGSGYCGDLVRMLLSNADNTLSYEYLLLTEASVSKCKSYVLFDPLYGVIWDDTELNFKSLTVLSVYGLYQQNGLIEPNYLYPAEWYKNVFAQAAYMMGMVQIKMMREMCVSLNNALGGREFSEILDRHGLAWTLDFKTDTIALSNKNGHAHSKSLTFKKRNLANILGIADEDIVLPEELDLDEKGASLVIRRAHQYFNNLMSEERQIKFPKKDNDQRCYATSPNQHAKLQTNSGFGMFEVSMFEIFNRHKNKIIGTVDSYNKERIDENKGKIESVMDALKIFLRNVFKANGSVNNEAFEQRWNMFYKGSMLVIEQLNMQGLSQFLGELSDSIDNLFLMALLDRQNITSSGRVMEAPKPSYFSGATCFRN